MYSCWNTRVQTYLYALGASSVDLAVWAVPLHLEIWLGFILMIGVKEVGFCMRYMTKMYIAKIIYS